MEQQENEQRLCEQGQHLALLLGATGAGTWSYHRNTRQLVVDQRYAGMLGESDTRCIQTPADALARIHLDERELVRRAYRSLYRGCIPSCELEFRMRHALGGWVWVLSRASVQGRGADGRPLLVAGIHLDVSQRKGIEQQLMLEREVLDGVIEGTQVGTWRWHVETGEYSINANWAQMLGYAVSDLQPISISRWSELLHPADVTPINQLLEQHLNGDTPFYEAEYRLRHRLGHWVWIHSRGKVISTSADGRALWMVGTHTDISVRKLVEAELRSANERFRLAAHSAGIGVWEIDIASGDVIWNQQMRQHFAIHDDLPSDDLRRLWRERLHPQDLQQTHEKLKLALGQRGLYEAEFRVCWPSAEVRHLKASGLVTQSDGPDDVRMVGIVQDVTELRRKEAQLQASRRFLDNAARIAGVGAWILHLRPDRMEWSSQTYRISQLDEDIAPTPELALSHYPPGAREQVQAAFRAAAREGKSFALEVPFFTCTGQSRWLQMVGEPQYEGGRVVQLIGAIRDITELKAQSAALEVAKEMAEAHSAAKSQLLANMSHEIRTPMNAILGMLALLRRTGLTSRQADYAHKAEGATRSLLGLINDVLDFSKIEAGRMTIDPHPFSPGELLRNLATILSVNLGLKPVELLFDIDPQLPHTLIGDDLRLQQVLLNLTSNAIKFTASGDVTLSIECAQRSAEHVTLDIAVTDTGIGIATEHQEKIFDGFTQAESSTTRRFGGTGLGLAISRHLVRLMGGDIHLLSAPGRGSVFRFSLQLPVAPAMPPTAEVAADPMGVLLVSEHFRSGRVFQRAAQSLGWHCHVAPTWSEAWACWQDNPGAYGLICLDAGLPEGAAESLSQAVRQRAPPDALPLLLLLVKHGQEGWHQSCASDALDVDAYVVKPVLAGALLRAVEEAQRRRQGVNLLQYAVAKQRLLGMRILLVEDNPNNQQIAVELLSAEGASVDVVANGLEALHYMGLRDDASPAPDGIRTGVDVILMDLQMPVMGGIEASEKLLRGAGPACPPIVAMTANALEIDRQSCLDAGMVAHVGKPFDLDGLVTLLRQIWHKGPSGVQPPASEPAAITPQLQEAQEEEGVAWLDQAQAMARMGGKQAFYRRMLTQFAAALPGHLQRLRPWCAQLPAPATAAMDEFVRELHTLKGLAATVGALRLSRWAAELEQRLRTGQVAASGPGADLCLIEEIMAATMRSIDEFLVAPVLELPPSVPTEASDFKAALGRLLSALQGCDMQSLTLMELLEQEYASQLGAHRQGLSEAVQALDFSRAAALCQSCIDDN